MAPNNSRRAARQFGQAAEMLAAVGQRHSLSRALAGLAEANSAQGPKDRADVDCERMLTDRELQVARLLGRGLTNRETSLP